MKIKTNFPEQAKSVRGILSGVLILIALVLLFSLMAKSCSGPKPATVQGKVLTDTVYVKAVERIYVLPEAVFTPEKVVVSTVPDTIRRKQREEGDIVTGVRVNSRSLEVQTIDPRGIVISYEYRLPDLDTEITIDETGKVAVAEDRKKKPREFWKKVGRRAVVVGAFVGGFLLGR